MHICMYPHLYTWQNQGVACHLPRKPRKKTEISPFKNNLMGRVSPVKKSRSFSPEDIFSMSLGGSFHSVSGSLQWLGFVPKTWGYGTPSSRDRTLWLINGGDPLGWGSKQALCTLPSLKLTFSPLKKGWLEYDRFLLGPGVFSGPNVKLREGIFIFLCNTGKKKHSKPSG